MKHELKLLENIPHNWQQVQNILEEAPDYSQAISGTIPGNKAGQSTFEALPDNFNRCNKHVLGVYLNQKLIGVIDLLIGFPTQDKAHIGLLLLSEQFQDAGHGKHTYQELERYIRQFTQIKTIRLSYVETNAKVFHFWNKQGFQVTGEKRHYENNLIQSYSILMEKCILPQP